MIRLLALMHFWELAIAPPLSVTLDNYYFFAISSKSSLGREHEQNRSRGRTAQRLPHSPFFDFHNSVSWDDRNLPSHLRPRSDKDRLHGSKVGKVRHLPRPGSFGRHPIPESVGRAVEFFLSTPAPCPDCLRSIRPRPEVPSHGPIGFRDAPTPICRAQPTPYASLPHKH